MKRKYDLGRNERFERVYLELDRPQEELRNIQENVKLANEMYLETSMERKQVSWCTVWGSGEAVMPLLCKLDGQGGSAECE